MKKIVSKKMKEVCVLLIVAVMVLSTSAVMANTIEKPIAMEFTIGTREIASLSIDEGGTASASMDEEAIYFYDPDHFPYQAVGMEGTPPYYWKTAIRLTSDELEQYIGWNLTAVRIFHGEIFEHSELIQIYGNGTSSNPGPQLWSEPYYFDSQGWFRINLGKSILIDGTDLWISCAWQTTDNDYPAVQDGVAAVDGKGDWAYKYGKWYEMQDDPEEIYDHNWGIEAIVEGEGIGTELSISDPTGPIGISISIKNIGENPATNVTYEFTVTGGIFGMINKTITGIVAELAINAEESLSSGLILGLGSINISISANADNADPISKTKTAFVLGPFVLKVE